MNNNRQVGWRVKDGRGPTKIDSSSVAQDLKRIRMQKKLQLDAQAMQNWIKWVQDATTPKALHNLVFDLTEEGLGFLESKDTRPRTSVVSGILTCTLAIRVWELHRDFLKSLLDCIEARRKGLQSPEALNAHFDAFATLWNQWIPGDFLRVLGYALLNYKHCEDVWTWKCQDKTVRAGDAHAVLCNMLEHYNLAKDIHPGLSKSEVDNSVGKIQAAQARSSYVLAHYEAVYERLQAKGQGLSKRNQTQVSSSRRSSTS